MFANPMFLSLFFLISLGAFLAGVPVQPVLLHYPNKLVSADPVTINHTVSSLQSKHTHTHTHTHIRLKVGGTSLSGLTVVDGDRWRGM